MTAAEVGFPRAAPGFVCRLLVSSWLIGFLVFSWLGIPCFQLVNSGNLGQTLRIPCYLLPEFCHLFSGAHDWCLFVAKVMEGRASSACLVLPGTPLTFPTRMDMTVSEGHGPDRFFLYPPWSHKDAAVGIHSDLLFGEYQHDVTDSSLASLAPCPSFPKWTSSRTMGYKETGGFARRSAQFA